MNSISSIEFLNEKKSAGNINGSSLRVLCHWNSVTQYFFYYYYIGLYYGYYYYSRVENKYIKLNTDIVRYSGMDYRYYIAIGTKIHNHLTSSNLNVYIIIKLST